MVSRNRGICRSEPIRSAWIEISRSRDSASNFFVFKSYIATSGIQSTSPPNPQAPISAFPLFPFRFPFHRLFLLNLSNLQTLQPSNLLLSRSLHFLFRSLHLVPPVLLPANPSSARFLPSLLSRPSLSCDALFSPTYLSRPSPSHDTITNLVVRQSPQPLFHRHLPPIDPFSLGDLRISPSASLPSTSSLALATPPPGP